MINFAKLCGWAGLFIALSTPSLFAAERELSVKAKFSGTLIENLTPCTIHPGDEILTFPLAQVSFSALKVVPEGPRQPFAIRLEDCELDPESAGLIEVSLSGQSDGNGMLEMDEGSTAAGVVIGFETLRGQPVPLNASSAPLKLPLNASEVVIHLQAYLKAVDSDSLQPGEFTATLNYIINYL
ncbi:fimbrial protein [Erwinia sp. CGal63]|uniref:fimbrial protein n=1 Tax=Erwinia sp. CGal63 TaxID=2919889 RepID=UPI00300AA642